jgi:hypothetical protein
MYNNDKRCQYATMTILDDNIALGIIIKENVTMLLKKKLSSIVSIVLYCYVLSDIVNYIVRDPFADGPVVGSRSRWQGQQEIDLEL